MEGAGPGRRTADRLPGWRPGRQAAPGRGGARARRARPGGSRREAAQGAVRWPGPAGRHRQGARDRARDDHLRRAGVVLGRPHPGPGPQPVRAAAGRTRPVLPVHRARPGPGQAGQRPGGGDVPGQAVRGRAGRGGLPAAAAPVHPGAARLGAGNRHGASRDNHPGRAAVAGPPAERLPVPYPLPPRRAALRGRGAGHARAANRAHSRALGRVPLPAGAGGRHLGPFGRKNRRDPAMRLRVLLEPHHGASYDQILALARATEESGLDAFFRSDHYQGIDPDDTGYRPTDSWTTLAGLAVQTERVRLGTLMTASTYRRPGPLAITVATVDAMSGGRAELGIGAAWIEQEHRYLGIPFPPLGERFDRLGEQLEIITGLWTTPPGEIGRAHV